MIHDSIGAEPRPTSPVGVVFVRNCISRCQRHNNPADVGIAARYPEDKNIASDPAVIFADDFESYTSPSQLTTKWNGAYQLGNIRIATEAEKCFSGSKSLEFSLPISTIEVSNSLKKRLSPEQDTVFLRAYTKFDAGYSVNTSNHNACGCRRSIRVRASSPCRWDRFLSVPSAKQY